MGVVAVDLEAGCGALECSCCVRQFVAQRPLLPASLWLPPALAVAAAVLFLSRGAQVYALFGVLGVALWLFSQRVVTEHVSFLPGIGVEMTSSTVLGGRSTVLVGREAIISLAIHEHVQLHQVVFVLILVTELKAQPAQKKIFPVFQHTLPRLNDLKRVLRAGVAVLKLDDVS